MIKKIMIGCCWLVIISSCRPEPEGIELVDELVVKTKITPDVDFSEYQTYTIPTDTIGYLTNVDPNDTIRNYSANFPYPRLVINAVKDNLDTRFTKTEIDENPDLGVNVY